ncbi:MAG TPA: envelope integrity protein Cei [Pseudonocardiaceae bacterium]
MAAAVARSGAVTGRSRYRRRRPLPALIMLAVLAVLAGMVWSKVFNTVEDLEAATRCNPPQVVPDAADPDQPSPTPGEPLPRDALDRTDPAPPPEVYVRVLNANGKRSEAGMVAEELYSVGVNKAGEPANDPLYPDFNLECYGQIRFGPNGASAARTLSLLIPCAQLVRDGRQDATVDLALGTKFDDVRPSAEARQVLDDLREWAEQHPTQNVGGQQAQAEARRAPVDEDLLKAARDVYC